MEPTAIAAALDTIRGESDPTLKSQRLASLCSALFRERGIELVVVGGSAIEFYTEGAYASGDLDLCTVQASPAVPLRLRQEIMAQLGGRGGPRSWEVAGLFVDLLGPVETEAATAFRKLQGPYGEVLLMKFEDLLVERVLVSTYPRPNPEALACARKLIAVALAGQVAVDWNEIGRLAASPHYRNLEDCRRIVGEVAHELKTVNPLHPA
jgi:hypothetical protein